MPARTTKQPAFRCLTYIALGLENGTTLNLHPGDYVPPSWAGVNGHQTSQWLANGTVTLVTDPDPAALEQAEVAASG
jgi:hypothetical protein